MEVLFCLTNNRFIQMYNFRFCWPSFTTGLLSTAWSYTSNINAPVCLRGRGGGFLFVTRTALLLLSAGNTTSNRWPGCQSCIWCRRPGGHWPCPPTAWCPWPWAEAGPIHAGWTGGVGGVKETGWKGVWGGGEWLRGVKGRVSKPEASSAARPLRRRRRL